jgi:hypothetical protein
MAEKNLEFVYEKEIPFLPLGKIALLQNEQSAGEVAQSMRDRSFSGYISTRGRLRSFPPLFQP